MQLGLQISASWLFALPGRERDGERGKRCRGRIIMLMATKCSCSLANVLFMRLVNLQTPRVCESKINKAAASSWPPSSTHPATALLCWNTPLTVLECCMPHVACWLFLLQLTKCWREKIQLNLQPKMPIVIGPNAQLRSLKRSQDLPADTPLGYPFPDDCTLKLMSQIKLANYLTLIWKKRWKENPLL